MTPTPSRPVQHLRRVSLSEVLHGPARYSLDRTRMTITSGDMAGIMMIAIQALEQRNAALQVRLAALEQAF